MNNFSNYLTKKNIIIAVVVILAIVAALIYFGRKSRAPAGGSDGGGFFGNLFPSSPSSTLGVGEPQTPSVLPGDGATGGATGNIAPEAVLGTDAAKNLPIGSLIQLSKDPVSSLAPKSDGVARYHKNIPENLGHLFERKADGSNSENRASNFTLPQVRKVVWAPDGARAIVFYTLGEDVRKLLIDYRASGTPKTNFLPDSVSDVAFSPDSKSLAFINDLGVSQNIFIATSDFKNQKKVADNQIPDLELSWLASPAGGPASGFLALKTKSSYAARGYLYTLKTGGGDFTKIVEGLGLDTVWNADGSNLIYSTVNGGGQMESLKLLNVKTGEVKDLGIKTIAEKCAFLRAAKNTAYCGVPKNIPRGQYPDAWWQGKVSFSDDFVFIDTLTGEIKLFVSTVMDIINPKALADDSYLLFRDKTSESLWSLKLK